MSTRTGPYCAVMSSLINKYIHNINIYMYNIYTRYILKIYYGLFFSFSFFFFNLTYSRWTSSLPSCLWSLRIFPSLPGSRRTIFYLDASSAILQLVNQGLNFTYSRSNAFRYGKNNTSPTLVRIVLTSSATTYPYRNININSGVPTLTCCLVATNTVEATRTRQDGIYEGMHTLFLLFLQGRRC